MDTTRSARGSSRPIWGPSTLTTPNDEVFVRLWRGFMTARVLMGLAIGALQLVIVALGQAVDPVVLMLCVAYAAATSACA